MTITNDSTALVSRDDELSLDEPINTDPTLREIVQSLGPVRQRFTKAAGEVVKKGAKVAEACALLGIFAASIVFLPTFGPMVADLAEDYAVARPWTIFKAEMATSIIGGVAFAASTAIWGASAITAMGLPMTETGVSEALVFSLAAGPFAVGGITGLLTTVNAVAGAFSGSSLATRLGDVRVPVSRLKGPRKPPELKP